MTLPKPPPKPRKQLSAKIASTAKPPENDGGGEPPSEPPQLPPDTRPIAPLWDMPEQNVRIPLEVLQVTFVYRYVLDEGGKMQRMHCGNVGADATGETIRRKWGGGRYFLQARIGSRILATREFPIEGPEINAGLPFAPIGELNSGLVTLNQDPQSAALFALFQMWMASQRTDFQAILGMQQAVLEKLAGQFGASMVATHLREQLANANGRVTELEKRLDDARDKERESEREALKRKYKGDSTTWVDVVEMVGEIAPPVLNALPPKFKTWLENMVTASGKSLPGGEGNKGLPQGVTEPAE